MNQWRTIRLYTAGSVLLPAAAVLLWPEKLWMHGMFILWTLLATGLWVWVERREWKNSVAQNKQALQLAAIRTLNHHRHDWMNDLQVLYGYLRLNKPDKTIDCVEKIRERMTVESRIAKLGVPSLILFLQSFRTLTNAVQLEIEVTDDVNLSELPLQAEDVSAALIDIINAYRFAVKSGTGDAAHLALSIARNEEAVIISLEYDGELNDASALYDKCKQRLKKSPLKAELLETDMKDMVLRAELRS
ncbi:Spo0B domain-containing protein [Paenibacillus tarimensis]|uniref:Spo0B domain-containing protein n=1 Tax=Paenibacillus tarimensis TaxID=416012 RepID=UPI001F295A0A|nr:Spo0B domain-containing protein [Paenibacillus tarimensis]MCF2943963.1 Spo0B domain-containing protein [Paenibacillus tarimensis]